MAIIVQKFGGTSVANAEKIRQAAGRVIKAVENGSSVVVVASARGKQTDEFITDAKELHPNPPAREMDQLFSTGEQQSIALLAMAIINAGYDAISFTGSQVKIMTDGVYLKARIKSIDTTRIRKQLEQGKVVLVAGFQGIDEDENIVTLGRGGSDTTAVALAAALDAQECEIYTDVDGIYTTDPRIFKNAAKMKQISFDEMLELASLGSSVMYVRAIEVGKNHNVKIHVRSSSEETEGTMIIPEESQMEEVVVSGATVQKDIAMITLTGIDNKPGNIANIFAQLAKAKVAVSGITKTEISTEKANLSFTISVLELNAAKETLEQIKDKVSYENITIREDVASVSVVGVGMRTHYEVAEKMFASLAKAKINIHSITSSQISISCVVDETQAEKALQAVCAAFELDKPAGQRNG